MKNRFNRLSSKEWLPFQKSWFRYVSDDKLISENVLFFTKAEESHEKIFYYGNDYSSVESICCDNSLNLVSAKDYQSEPLQFALVDMRSDISKMTGVEDYLIVREKIMDISQRIFENLQHKRFLCVMIPNKQINENYFPFSWDIAYQLSTVFSLKDEKIACMSSDSPHVNQPYFAPDLETFYCLYFRKDENSKGKYIPVESGLFSNNQQKKGLVSFSKSLPYWFILKPSPRKKNEILHPAKYPEELVSMFLNVFTRNGDNVLDPMSGTGSTQIAALKSGCNAYGTELSEFFMEIANERCQNLVNPQQKELFLKESISGDFKILNKDARLISKDDFPPVDYVITSPPYWDMLNMKGAENQAKRIEKGLLTSYSELEEDLGNLVNYDDFIDELVQIYFNIIDLMESGSYLTIIVKNIKKKGKNYPFAWDLSARLMERVVLLPEVFWCQDDINLAPYGYGNTFVSNTFHQYCLNFMKP